MLATAKPLTTDKLTYAKLVELLSPFGFAQQGNHDKHCLLQHQDEPKWRIVFPGGKRFKKPVDMADLMSLRAHLDYWGLLESKTVDGLLNKLQE